jgi:hypothetical protein
LFFPRAAKAADVSGYLESDATPILGNLRQLHCLVIGQRNMNAALCSVDKTLNQILQVCLPK